MMVALIAIMGLGLVDSYFISYLGTTELAAIGFIVPITSMVTSFGLGLGMAISSLNSKLIGAQQSSNSIDDGHDTAARLISDGFALTLALAALTTVFLLIFLEPLFRLIGADNATMPAILEYMNVWIFAVSLVMISMVCSSTYRSLGDTRMSANIAISMTLWNVVLDPLLIFGLGPFPEMGMQGAALATVLSVFFSSVYACYQLGAKEKLLILALPLYEEFKKNVAALMEIAIPAVLANAIVPLSAAILTTIVAQFGSQAVAGYGVGTRVEAVSLIVIYALSSTLPMFIGQNIGAGKKQRVAQALTLSFRFTFALQLLMCLVLALMANLIAQQFSDEPEVINTIKLYLWIVPLTYGFSGVVILINVSMNVLGKPRLALYINLLRVMLFYLPFAYAGAQLAGINGLFVGIAVGNASTFLLARTLLIKVKKELAI